ncbi:SpoIIE family protein phosphatase [Jidongwangia harbinensis]|uniref:SpoIIE family protein phosphatase n=1 Tax=Jidongwangia harbinensis TaxID=2878561 RepID=UPI001CDA183D|nr:SpoIIE family protein phosphatase [Jidongwangia harbinensis]MCA2216377.1 SpoIIE family protein phosphatase [Jidongwangia harbinensis]MCA2217112.1 SpoIIE family protein phosphatase [Jidongwangia harbinensis]
MLGGRHAYVDAVQDLRAPVSRLTAGAGTVERAVGLLAGRTRCRLTEAHGHLLRMAAEQQRDLTEVAAGVIALLDLPDPGADPSATPLAALFPGPAPARRSDPWRSAVQHILDALPGSVALLTPVRDPAGRLADLRYAAVSPEAVTPDGRPGRHLLGTTLGESFPESLVSDRWARYAAVLDSGDPAETGPFRHGDGTFSVRAHKLGDDLLVSWTRHDGDRPESERLAGTERLGNLGWGEWDLVSGEVHWSAQLYRIYERDPALGPLSREESAALTLPEDQALRMAAAEAFERAERVDITLRVRIGRTIKHLRTVIDAIRDAEGRPLRIYGIVQDVTAREDSVRRLADVEQQLAEQRRTLAAEHDLAARLQHIILPLPDGPLEFPGLKVALRYLPAGQESLVGGDWYHAGKLRDGSVLLAVGDVSGHGMQAATTMAQLRHALRALAVTTSDPAVLLDQLNRLTCELEAENPELGATAVIARYDPVRRRLTWAQAGHPPPLLSRFGRTAPLSRPSGPMLGVLEDARYECAEVEMCVGDVLLLYTDGLVEHRRYGLDDGLATVVSAVDEAVAASPERPLGELLARLQQANPDDDTCILAARPATGETQDLRRFLRSRSAV